jgi:hypothetical protein
MEYEPIIMKTLNINNTIVYFQSIEFDLKIEVPSMYKKVFRNFKGFNIPRTVEAPSATIEAKMGFTWSLKNEEKNSTTEYQNIPPVKQ